MRIANNGNTTSIGRYSQMILVVDDDPDVCNFLQRFMTHAGHESARAADGAEALELIRTSDKAVDLVITDENMPKLGGIQLLELARDEGFEMPFILIGGYLIDEERRARRLKCGFAAVFCKPVNVTAELLPKIRELIGGDNDAPQV